MKKDLSKVLLPDDPLYSQAVEALKRYNQAQADGVMGAELERLRVLAEHEFKVVTDHQLRAFGRSTEEGH